MKLRPLALCFAGLLLAACGKESPAPVAETTPAADTAPAAETAPAATAAEPVAAASTEEKVLNIYNWSDYIAEDTIANFEKETGIKVVYDVFDSNELLEAKLVSGNTGYDLVVPSLQYLARQVAAGVFQPLDKTKLTNYGNLDPQIMSRIAVLDPENKYALNWLWGTTGIGYNVDKVKAALGENAPVDSWDLVFKVENISKLKDCGVSVLDTPQELLTVALNYLGEDPNSFDPAVIAKAEALMTQIRPYITKFHSSQYIDELANGDICLAVGWSGDVFQAQARAEEAKNGIKIAYNIPREGAPMWFDMIAIPKDAKHPDNAHLFLNYILRPQVMADISNAVAYASANKASLPMVDADVLSNPGVYPTPEAAGKLFTFAVLPPDTDRLMTRIWTKLKTGT